MPFRIRQSAVLISALTQSLGIVEQLEAQRTNIEKELRSGEPSIKLLYTTPESLRAPRLAAALQVESQSKVELYTDVKCEHKSSKYGYDFCCQNNSNLDEHF